MRQSGICGPLSDLIGPDRMCPGASKVVQSVMGRVTRGSVRVMPHGGTCGKRFTHFVFFFL